MTNVGSKAGVCDGLVALVDEHSVALGKDGGPLSTVSGVRLISAFDKACYNG